MRYPGAFRVASGGRRLAPSNRSECVVFPRYFPLPTKEGSRANTGLLALHFKAEGFANQLSTRTDMDPW